MVLLNLFFISGGLFTQPRAGANRRPGVRSDLAMIKRVSAAAMLALGGGRSACSC